MIGVDCNILVQLAIADHPANGRTLATVQAKTAGNVTLVLPPLVVNEFLHVVTDPRRFNPPLTMSEAVDWTEDFLKNPHVALIEPARASMDQTLRWMRQFNLGRKRILDTYLAAVLHAAGVRPFNDLKSRRISPSFGVFEVVTP